MSETERSRQALRVPDDVYSVSRDSVSTRPWAAPVDSDDCLGRTLSLQDRVVRYTSPPADQRYTGIFLFLAQTGDVFILDNLAVHKSTKAAQGLKDRGALFPSSRPRGQISIPLRWLSPRSRPTCAPQTQRPSRPFQMFSHQSAISSTEPTAGGI